jgi:hypothetical protein
VVVHGTSRHDVLTLLCAELVTVPVGISLYHKQVYCALLSTLLKSAVQVEMSANAWVKNGGAEHWNFFGLV